MTGSRAAAVMLVGLLVAVALLLQGCPSLIPNRGPTAQFEAQPTRGPVPLTVEFDASASSDPDKDAQDQIVSYEWDFGDGETATGEQVEHTYDSAGTFTATLTVTDGGGQTAQASETISAGLAGFAWASSFGGTSTDHGVGIASGGSVLVTGTIDGGGSTDPEASFNGFSLNPDCCADEMFLVKYSRSGQAQWAAQSQGGGDAGGFGVASDSRGNALVVGTFGGAAPGSATFDDVTLQSPNHGGDVFLAKYDPKGSLLWVNAMVGPGRDEGKDVATGPNDNVFIAGHFSDSLDLGGTALTSSGGLNLFLAKYAPDGTLLWARQIRGGFQRPFDVDGLAADSMGNVYMARAFSGTARFDGTTLTSAGSSDGFVAKYGPQGDLRWAKRTGGSRLDRIRSVAADAEGNIVVTGRFAGTADVGGTTLSSAGGSDIFIAKYRSNGVLMWAKRAGGPDDDKGNSVAVDDGNAFITGSFRGTAEFNGETVSSAGGRDTFVVKYDPRGNLLGVRQAGGPEDPERGDSLTIGSNGNIFLTGAIASSSAEFGKTVLSSNGRIDVFVAKLGDR